MANLNFKETIKKPLFITSIIFFGAAFIVMLIGFAPNATVTALIIALILYIIFIVLLSMFLFYDFKNK